jgi:hypothetical protein
MAEADPVRQEFDPSLEISRTHSGDSVIRCVSFEIGSVAELHSRQEKSERTAFPVARDATPGVVAH